MNHELNRKAISIVFILLITFQVTGQDPGVIGNNQTICYGSAPFSLFFVTTPSGGTQPYSYRWQRSNDGTTWNDITGTTAARETYTPPVLGRTAWFRCRVTDYHSTVVGNTNPVVITVSTGLTAGTIGSQQTIYPGEESAPLTQITAPSGGGGTYTYKWQRSPDGMVWYDIQNANLAEYSPGILNSTTWFRRWISDGICGSVASNPIRIYVVSSVTLYTSELPVTPDKNYNFRFDMGTRFLTFENGIITKVRMYVSVSEEGAHQVRFWKLNNKNIFELISGPINWEFESGPEGWREFDLTDPVVVYADNTYMISITTGDNYFAHSATLNLLNTNQYLKYLGSNYSDTIGKAPYLNVTAEGFDGYFRDVVFVPFSAGTAGVSDTICYNTQPATLAQITAPSEGFGPPYTIQWQSSPNNSVWSDILGANGTSFTPPVLTNSTFYRRRVTSGGISINGQAVYIRVDKPFYSAKLNADMTIYSNTSAFINIELSGGTSPYSIHYDRNGASQPNLSEYKSGTGVYTGILDSGSYVYSISSVVDAYGCSPQSLGTNITITSTLNNPGKSTNKALVIVNTGIINYPDFNLYIRPYIDWFGIPYDTCDLNSMILPDLNNYALLILGHPNVFNGQYPYEILESSVFNGVGLYSFDPYLFTSPSQFNLESTSPYGSVESGIININTDHFITQYHASDSINVTNDVINLKIYDGNPPLQATLTIEGSIYSITNSRDLATMSDGTNTAPLLQVGTYGAGKLVRWTTWRWMHDSYLGPIYGMDDLVWRSLVWAARKPFVMQGLPPMITMRVDDVTGMRSMHMPDLEWMKICNEYGLIPWCGIFTNEIPAHLVDTLRDRINRGLATASPHAIGYFDFIFYNYNNIPDFDSEANIREAWDYCNRNNIPVSNYVLPHWYLIDTTALNTLNDIGVEFIGNVISWRGYPFPLIEYPGPWLQSGPYRKNRLGTGHRIQPHFYSGYVTLNRHRFFNVLSEIGDDGGYEWFPKAEDIPGTIARGIRHLRRALNGMFLPVLFTHEDQTGLFSTDWRRVISAVTQGVSSYNPEYKSTDYAVKYIRAKENIKIINVTDHTGIVNITCSGINDMQTKCYIFQEFDGQIAFRIVDLPQVGSLTTPVTVAVLK